MNDITDNLMADEWRELITDVSQRCRSGAASITISSEPGSGRSIILDHVGTELDDDFEFVLRIEGDDIGTAELELRRWLNEQQESVGPDTFAEIRSRLNKSHHLALLVDRASDAVLAELVPPELGGALVATTNINGPRLAEHRSLPDFPAREGWELVQRGLSTGIVITAAAIAPAPSAMAALASLTSDSLRALIADFEAQSGRRTSQVKLRDVLIHIVDEMDPGERSVLATIGFYGPGITTIPLIGTVAGGRRRIMPIEEVRRHLGTLAERGLLRKRGDDVLADSGLIQAIHDPDPGNRAQQRRALHAVTQLSATGRDPTDEQLRARLRFLDWCSTTGFHAPAIQTLRESTISVAMERGLYRTALVELTNAIRVDHENEQHDEQGHHLVDRGLVERTLGRLDHAIDSFEQALAAFGRVKKSQRNEAIAISNIGMVYQQLGRDQAAIDSLDRARAVLSRADGDTTLEDVKLSIPLSVSLLRLGFTARAQAELGSIRTGLNRFEGSDPSLEAIYDDVARLERVAKLAIEQQDTQEPGE